MAPIFFHKVRWIADLLLTCTLFFIGLQLETYQIPTHTQDTPYLIQGRCKEILTNHNYILSVGEENFYLNSYYTDSTYQPGDSLRFYAKLQPLRAQNNPGEFSYSRYLKQKKVFYQIIPVTNIQKNGFSHDIPSFFHHLREKVMQKTTLLTQDSTCQQLINTLCLGYKLELDGEFRQLFTTTGTIHLLSVSGLHTGALYLFFLFILRHSGFKKRRSELLLLPLLWAYACLTGLSPSVVRASTILTFIAIGKAFNRTYIPLNALCASAFLNLLINPSALYSLSFLLSYSAYSGILIFYPILFKLPGALPSLLSKIYACCCITIAAQLPTLPLAAYYFHSINLNGFLANLIAVPAATLFLYCASCCLLLPLWIGQSITICCEWLAQALIRFLQFFAPYSINLQHLYPSATTIVFVYICMITTGILLFHPHKRWLHLNILSYTCLLFLLIGQEMYLKNRQEVVILHYHRQSLIMLQYKGFCVPLANTLDSSIITHPYVKLNKSRVLETSCGWLDSNLSYIDNRLLTLYDTLLILSPQNSNYSPCKTVVITNNLSPREVESTLISPLPQRIILDGSNHKYNINRWKEFALRHQIPLHSTAERGAVLISLQRNM